MGGQLETSRSMILDLPSWTLQEFFLSSIWDLFSFTGPKVCAAWVAPTFVDSSGAASFVQVCIPEFSSIHFLTLPLPILPGPTARKKLEEFIPSICLGGWPSILWVLGIPLNTVSRNRQSTFSRYFTFALFPSLLSYEATTLHVCTHNFGHQPPVDIVMGVDINGCRKCCLPSC